jgi:hypothetical protein
MTSSHFSVYKYFVSTNKSVLNWRLKGVSYAITQVKNPIVQNLLGTFVRYENMMCSEYGP